MFPLSTTTTTTTSSSSVHDNDDDSSQELSLILLPKPASLLFFPAVFVPPRISISTLTDNDNDVDTNSLWSVCSRNLQEKLLGDVVVAAVVTATVSPFLTIIDKALVQYAAGSHSLANSAWQSATVMVRHPVQYLKSPTFLWMWATYASTYSAANALRTYTEHQEYLTAAATSTSTSDTVHKRKSPSSQTAAAAAAGTMTIFLGTTAVNTSASLLKDRAYARLFGNPLQAKMSVPPVSYGLWMARDFAVIGSSFILPTHVATLLREHNSNLTAADAQKIAQLATPVAAQLVAGPLHYVGLDFYNRPLVGYNMAAQLSERARFLYQGFVPVVGARMARVLPGYGIGGVWNTRLRSQWRDALMQRQVRQILQRKVTTTTRTIMTSTTTSASAATKTSSYPNNNNSPAALLQSQPSNNTMRIRNLVELIRAKRQD
jgi:hypothetical protein